MYQLCLASNWVEVSHIYVFTFSCKVCFSERRKLVVFFQKPHSASFMSPLITTHFQSMVILQNYFILIAHHNKNWYACIRLCHETFALQANLSSVFIIAGIVQHPILGLWRNSIRSEIERVLLPLLQKLYWDAQIHPAVAITANMSHLRVDLISHTSSSALLTSPTLILRRLHSILGEGLMQVLMSPTGQSNVVWW